MIFIWVGAALLMLFGLTALTGAPYVPSHKRAVRRAFSELRPLTGDDLLVDIGSGDGTVLREAARRGARGYGIEINPALVIISWFLNRRYREKLAVRWASFWRVKFPEGTTVVYTFGESRDIDRMYKKVQAEAMRLGRPIDFISYGFEVSNLELAGEISGCFLYQASPLQKHIP